jgi:spermidine synthase
MIHTLINLGVHWNTLSSSTQQDYLVQLRQLYRNEGWWSEPQDTLEKIVGIISGSHCFVLAVGQKPEMILGMGRAISDRASDAYVQDVVVRPEFRKQGIASSILNRIVTRLQNDGMTWIGLIAQEGTRPFYDMLGFSVMPGAQPMIMNQYFREKPFSTKYIKKRSHVR